MGSYWKEPKMIAYSIFTTLNMRYEKWKVIEQRPNNGGRKSVAGQVHIKTIQC